MVAPPYYVSPTKKAKNVLVYLYKTLKANLDINLYRLKGGWGAGGYYCSLPHVDVKGLGFVDFEASRPGAVGGIHEAHTQQLVIVIAWPVEDDTGARQGGDVTLWVGCALG